MAHFYLDETLAASEVGGVVTLTGAEARHAVTVSRTRVGEPLRIGNGAGLVVEGEVESARPEALDVRVARVVQHEAPEPRLLLAQALAKGDRDELAVQAATEIGVDEVIPWQAARSVSRWQGPKAEKGRERWRTIAREAAKQSLRAWLPPVRSVHGTNDLTAVEGVRMLVLDPLAPTRLSGLELDERDLLLVVGPEGGIAQEEFERFEAAGGERVRLGDGVLRTSTAGPAALAVLAARLGRW